MTSSNRVSASRGTAALGSIALAVLIRAGAAAASDVAAVLSSDIPPYQEAYEGLKSASVQAVARIAFQEGRTPLPEGTKIVVAFGAKASLERYPEGVTLITGVSPGLAADALDRRRFVRVSMEPSPDALLAKLKEIQPSLKTLSVLWSGEASQDTVARLQAAGARFGIAVRTDRVESSDELPATLRKLAGRAEGLWLPADPLLINPHNFEMIKQYSLSNGLPLYVPVEGLLNQGATASISIDFREIGRTAAVVAQQILDGKTPERDVYPSQIREGLNLKSARQVGLALTDVQISRANKVLR